MKIAIFSPVYFAPHNDSGASSGSKTYAASNDGGSGNSGGKPKSASTDKVGRNSARIREPGVLSTGKKS
jgi:hypothetical protein